jgi:type II secretory pathway component GspD/PulD (secretin)
MPPPAIPAPPTITRLPDTSSEFRPSYVAKGPTTRNRAAGRTIDEPAPGPDHISIAWQKRIVYRLKNAPATDIANAIERFYGGEGVVRIVAEPVSNSLLISALPNVLDEVVQHVEKLDRQLPAVTVEVCIARLTKTAKTDPAKTAAGKAGSAFSCTPGVLPSGESIDSQLRTLEKQGRLEILARPKLMTLDNQPAFLHVGQRVPTIGSLGGSSEKKGLAIVRQNNVGVVLGVTARVGGDNTITMQVDVEKSDLAPPAAGIPIAQLPSGEILHAPVILSTTVQTTISVSSGRTVTVAAFAADATSNEPKEQIELVILLCPRVVPAEAPAARAK